MSRKASIRKRKRQRTRHANRMKQADQQSVRVKTTGLISYLLERPQRRALAEAIAEAEASKDL
jgi:hypothetical protein